MSAPPLIFICYAGPDRAIAERIHRALDRAGLNPWCDANDLIPGQKWDEAIPAALTQAAVVLVLVTTGWPMVGDEGVGWYGPEEVALAIDLRRQVGSRAVVVPVRLDGAGISRVPYGLRRVADIEARAVDLGAVVDGVRRVVAERTRTIRSPERPELRAPLAEAEARIVGLNASSADPGDIAAAIADRLAIRRSLRAGGHLKAGDALDRYVLAERLGQGGFASVWRAYDPLHNRHVALKVLHGRWNRDESKVERFRRGVKQMARLRHPGVVPVLDAERVDDGWHFFVMALMRGGDLYRAITRPDEPLSADEGLRAVLEVADALAEAHRRGIVHRDVKPQNVLLGDDGRARLTDFDLVRAPDTTGGTETRGMGSFLYAAPEQLDRAHDVGPRADVYALGMTAVFVLTGRQPPSRCKWQPEATVAALPATSAVQACLLEAIALEEGERPADAAAFGAALHRALTRRIGEAPASAAATANRPALVPITAGEFTMGSPEGEPGRYERERAHPVKLTRNVLMAETAVTQAQYAALVGENPSRFQGTPADGERPVENVSWLEAVKYCNSLSTSEGLQLAYAIEGEAVTWNQEATGYRLPTEAEWEYAARAGTSTATFAGDLHIRGKRNAPVLDAIAWYGGNSGSTHPRARDSSDWAAKQYEHTKASTHPVKVKLPNGWGLYDMLGNVYEWIWDRYATDYPLSHGGDPLVDPVGPADGASRVVRGGSFKSFACRGRVAYRYKRSPSLRYDRVGFRPVRSLRMDFDIESPPIAPARVVLFAPRAPTGWSTRHAGAQCLEADAPVGRWHREELPGGGRWAWAHAEIERIMDLLVGDAGGVFVYSSMPYSLGAVLGNALLNQPDLRCRFFQAEGPNDRIRWIDYGPGTDVETDSGPILGELQSKSGRADKWALVCGITWPPDDAAIAHGLACADASDASRVDIGPTDPGHGALPDSASIESAVRDLESAIDRLVRQPGVAELHVFYNGPLAVLQRAAGKLHQPRCRIVFHERGVDGVYWPAVAFEGGAARLLGVEREGQPAGSAVSRLRSTGVAEPTTIATSGAEQHGKPDQETGSMTMTIAQAFDRFRREIVPDAKRAKRANNVQRHLRDQLKHHLAGLRETFITGSLARSTAIKPLSDVDVFVVLDPNTHSRSQQPKATLRLLQKAVKAALGGTATVRLQTRSIGVIYQAHDIHLDLVPAILDAEGGYYIPDRDRDAWIITNPRLHKRTLDAADQAAASKLRPLIRMAKVARRRSFPKLGSYHLEAMACRLGLGPATSFDVGICELLLGLEAQVIQRIPDPSGRGPAIHLELDARRDLERRLKEARLTAERAVAHADAGRIDKAHAQWRHLFGADWPG